MKTADTQADAATVTTPRCMRTREAARYAAVSLKKLRNWVHSGDLPVVSDGPGDPWRIDQADLDKLIDSKKKTMKKR